MEEILKALVDLFKEVEEHMEHPPAPLYCSASGMRHCAYMEHAYDEVRKAMQDEEVTTGTLLATLKRQAEV